MYPGSFNYYFTPYFLSAFFLRSQFVALSGLQDIFLVKAHWFSKWISGNLPALWHRKWHWDTNADEQLVENEEQEGEREREQGLRQRKRRPEDKNPSEDSSQESRKLSKMPQKPLEYQLIEQVATLFILDGKYEN